VSAITQKHLGQNLFYCLYQRFSLVFFLLILTLFISGFSILTQQNSNGEMGVYYRNWSKMPVHYIVDSGHSGLEGYESIEFVKDCFRVWENVSCSAVSFQYDGQTKKPITRDLIEDETSEVLRIGDNVEEVIFDPDGDITEFFNLDPETVLGVGLPIGYDFESVTFEDPDKHGYSGEIFDGFILINTSATNDEESIKSTVIHEIGHFIGLGHTTVHPFIFGEDENNDKFVDINETDQRKVPPMFAFALPQDFYGQTLEPDDIAAVCSLYPKCSFEEQFGAISGSVSNRTGAPLFGASVAALQYDSSGDEIITAVSALSGYSTGSDGDGEFFISGLPPGEYILYVEPVTEKNMSFECDNIGLAFSECDTLFQCEIFSDLSCYEGGGEIHFLDIVAGNTLNSIDIIVV